jgi:hypothetical protein
VRAAPLLQQGSTDCTFCEYIHVYVYVSRVGLPSSCSTLKLDGARVYRTHPGAIQLQSFSDVQDTRRLPCASFVCASLSLSVDTPTHKSLGFRVQEGMYCGQKECKEKNVKIPPPLLCHITNATSLPRSSSSPPPSFTQSPFPPRSLVREGHTSPHRHATDAANINPKISAIRIGSNR